MTLHWIPFGNDGTWQAGRFTVQRAHAGGYFATEFEAEDSIIAVKSSPVYATTAEAKAWADGRAGVGEGESTADLTEAVRVAYGVDGGFSVVSESEVSF